jgi:type IX secretion system PorP/SprF family membrane protein
MYLRYAFRLPLSKTSFFALALNAGFKNNKVMYADVNTIQSNDIAFNQNTNFWSPNTGFSIAYVQPEFSAAISVNELFQNNAPMKMDFSPQNMHLYAYLNYTLNAGEQMEWKFGLQGKMAANAPIHFQTHVQVLFSEKILAGIGFAADKSLTLQTGCMIGSSLRIGYAYDLYFGGMHGQQNGSHELFLGAGFPFYKNAFAKRKYLRKNGDWKKF